MKSVVRITVALCLIGAALLTVAGTASAQEIEGGCNADVNGRAPSSMTEEDPLLLDREKTVRARGQAPASAQSGDTQTDIHVVVFGLAVPVESTDGEGTRWGGAAEVPGYLKTLAPGIYRVEADGSGPGWGCTASGYVELEGGPLSVATGVGAVLAGLGIAMSLGSRGGGSNVPDRSVIARKTGIVDREALVRPDRPRTAAADVGYLVLLVIAFFLAWEEIVDFGENIGFAAPAAAAAAGGQGFWLRGRVLRGFFGGLFLGLGAALLLHQFDLWTLDLTEGLIFPMLVAVATAVRAWIGSAFRVAPPPAGVREPEGEPVGVSPASTAAPPS
jgi:hypothetical protein